MFYKHVGIKDSNEVEVLAIMKAIRIYSNLFQDSLIGESYLANATSWVKSFKSPWKMQFLLNKIHRSISFSGLFSIYK